MGRRQEPLANDAVVLVEPAWRFVALCFETFSWCSPTLSTFSLLTSEDFWLFLDFPAFAMFSAYLLEGIKTLRSLREEILTNL